MNPEADSFSSNNGLISQKRKKKTKPNYNSTGNTLTFVKSPLRPSSYHNQTEDLRDVHYDYLWKVSLISIKLQNNALTSCAFVSVSVW